MGVVVAASMLWAMDGFRFSLLRNIVQISPTVPIGAALVLVFAWILGGPCGTRIANGTWWTATWLGIAVSWSSLLLAACCGAVVYLLTEWKRYSADDLHHVLIEGPLGVALFGVIPAALLGMAYGFAVRRVVARSRASSR